MKAYINIYDNIAIVSTTKEPDMIDFSDDGMINHKSNINWIKFEEAKKNWRKSCIEIQNSTIPKNVYKVILHFGNIDYRDYTYEEVVPGKEYEIEVEKNNDKFIITSINNE